MLIKQKTNRIALPNTEFQTVKGTTKIELYNPNTRIKKVFRDENTFQSANISKWLASMGESNIRPFGNSTFTAAPWKCMVGGLLLFRDTITVGSQFMQAGNKMTGKAAVDIVNNSTPTELGSYNNIESSAGVGAITQVYDFTTSQANGDINCVCLTSKEGGIVGYGNASGGRYTGAQYTLGFYGREIAFIDRENARGILAENGNRYFVKAPSTDIVIEERNSIGIPNKSSIFTGIAREYSFAKADYNSKFNTDSFYFYYVGNNKIRIISAGYGSVAAGDTFYYLEFDCENHTLTQKSLVNSYSGTIYIASGYNPGYKAFFTRDGKFIPYTMANQIYGPVIFDLATGIVEFDGMNRVNYDPTHGCLCVGEDLYIYNKCMIDLQNDTVYPIDTNDLPMFGGGAYSRGDASGDFADGYYQSGCGNQASHVAPLIANPLYLATINNLDNTVQKTAAQTMKVIYTLTEV